MTININRQKVVVLQCIRELSQSALRRSVEVSLVCSKKDTRIESNLNSLKTICILNLLYLCILNLLSLLGYLIHMTTNNSTSTSTYSTTNCSTYGCITCQLTNDTTNNGTTTSTYQCTCTLICSTADNSKHAHCQCNSCNFIHFAIIYMLKMYYQWLLHHILMLQR